MNNLFLTGRINVGKSTMIKRIIEQLNIRKEEIGGFYTRPYIIDNQVKEFYIEPLNFNCKSTNIRDRMIGYTSDGIKRIGNTATFENIGVEILDNCIKNDFKLIIMDELGFFENTAYQFQQKVHETLNNKKVIGVIKPLSTPFLDTIRERKDVIEVEITEDNRENVYRRLAKEFNV